MSCRCPPCVSFGLARFVPILGVKRRSCGRCSTFRCVFRVSFFIHLDDTNSHDIFSGILPHGLEQVPNSSQVCHVGRFAFRQVTRVFFEKPFVAYQIRPSDEVGGPLETMLVLLRHFAFGLFFVFVWVPGGSIPCCGVRFPVTIHRDVPRIAGRGRHWPGLALALVGVGFRPFA